MKKLLALVLCVMMLVAVVPASAYAVAPVVVPVVPVSVVEATQAYVEAIYEKAAADDAIVAAAVIMDTSVTKLINIVADITGMTAAEAEAYAAELRPEVGALIAAEFIANGGPTATDPLAYADAYVDAVATVCSNLVYFNNDLYNELLEAICAAEIIAWTIDGAAEWVVFVESVADAFAALDEAYGDDATAALIPYVPFVDIQSVVEASNGALDINDFLPEGLVA